MTFWHGVLATLVVALVGFLTWYLAPLGGPEIGPRVNK